MKGRETISVLVITYNEEDRIAACLEAVKWADEIVLVDSFSTDRTVEIARNYTDRILEQQWLGFAGQRNWGIAQCQGDWILILDADEQVLPELAEEIRQLLKAKSSLSDGYYIKRRYYFLGKWMHQAGTYPGAALRLFRKGHGRYSDRLVGEYLEVDGAVSTLTHDLLHDTCRSMVHCIQKNSFYSKLAAEELWRKGKKSNWFKCIFHPLWAFFKKYILKKGCLDGMRGLTISFMEAHKICYKYLILWDLQRHGK